MSHPHVKDVTFPCQYAHSHVKDVTFSCQGCYIPMPKLTHSHVNVCSCTCMQFLSQDIVQALEDPDGIEVLSALLESGANINLPTKVCLRSACDIILYYHACTCTYLQ